VLPRAPCPLAGRAKAWHKTRRSGGKLNPFIGTCRAPDLPEENIAYLRSAPENTQGFHWDSVSARLVAQTEPSRVGAHSARGSARFWSLGWGGVRPNPCGWQQKTPPGSAPGEGAAPSRPAASPARFAGSSRASGRCRGTNAMARRLGAFARVVLRGPSGWPCSCAGRPRGGHGAGWPGRGVCREVWVEGRARLGERRRGGARGGAWPGGGQRCATQGGPSVRRNSVGLGGRQGCAATGPPAGVPGGWPAGSGGALSGGRNWLSFLT
jgi:hypothetical protein